MYTGLGPGSWPSDFYEQRDSLFIHNTSRSGFAARGLFRFSKEDPRAILLCFKLRIDNRRGRSFRQGRT